MKSNNKGGQIMFIQQILKSFSRRLNAHTASYLTVASSKMELTIVRLQQAKQVDLLRTDYLE